MTNEHLHGADIGQLRASLKRLRKRRWAALRDLREMAEQLRVASGVAKDSELTDLYLEALDMLNVDDLTHPDLVAVTRTHGLKTLPQADSFWRSIVTRRRKKQLGTVPEKRLGLNKQKDELFARRSGIATVHTLFRGGFKDAPRDRDPTVLKPVRSSGSRGAFYIFQDRLFAIANSQEVSDWDDLEDIAKEQLRVADLDDMEWELQELVTLKGNPAPDLKFYSFYGEIGAVLEVSRHPEQHYAYFDGDLQPIEFRMDVKPKFADLSSTSIVRGELSSEKIQVAQRLSLEIPVPFMRIDFLHSDDDLIFCEFSAAPGMSHALAPTHDQRLGKLYHEAEIRLVNDLLAGKTFETFMEYSGRSRAK